MHPDLAKFLNILSIPINGIFVFINFSEYYKIVILENIETYTFGSESNMPYYYKTSELYSNVMLTYSIIFLMLFLLGLWNIKQKIIHGHLILTLTFALILVQLFHSLYT